MKNLFFTIFFKFQRFVQNSNWFLPKTNGENHPYQTKTLKGHLAFQFHLNWDEKSWWIFTNLKFSEPRLIWKPRLTWRRWSALNPSSSAAEREGSCTSGSVHRSSHPHVHLFPRSTTRHHLRDKKRSPVRSTQPWPFIIFASQIFSSGFTLF